MRAIVVDDNQLSLDILQMQLENLGYFVDIKSFTDPSEAFEYTKKNETDIAFLDIMMDKLDGITLAGAIRAFHPGCYIIFTTASENHALDAFKIHASGYLVKPVTKESLKEQLDAIFVHHPQTKAAPRKALRIQCFGNFEAFDSAGKPLTFRYKKSKELLAYLVHRKGAVCSNAEIASVLYEDRDENDSLRSQLRNLVADLSKALKDADASAALYRERAGTAIVPEETECDYYGYLQNRSSVTFHGEYMSQYDWAEATCAFLNNGQ